MSWWDDFLTRAGDALIGPQMPFGAMGAPMDPRQRQGAIGNALLTLGSTIASAPRQQPIISSIGQGFQNLATQGNQRAMQQLQMGLIGSKIAEQQRANQTREALKRNLPPGVTAEMVDAMDIKDVAKLIFEAGERGRNREAISGMGAFPGMDSAPTAGPPLKPTGGVFDVPPQFAPQIQAASVKHGVPVPLLASTAWNESRWNPNAVNKNDQGPGINSVGLMQWGEQWAKARGFDPRDPNASIEHTAAALKEYAGKYGGNWLLARLAYGWGPGNVDKWLQSGGDPERVPSGAKVWLPRAAFGIADEQEARAAWPRVAGMLRPGPIQGPTSSQPTEQSSPVQPAQFTPTQGQPTAPQQQPTQQAPNYANDPVVREAAQAARIAQQQGDIKAFQAARAKAAERIATLEKEAREGAPVERIWDPEKGQSVFVPRPQAVGKEPATIREQESRGLLAAQEQRRTAAYKQNVEDAAKAATEVQAGALQARSAKANAQQLSALLDDVETGRFKNTTTDIKRAAKGVGIDLEKLGITDDVPRAEAARALVGQMALQLRNPAGGAGMPGALSDKDREFLMSMVPSLETTPEGRKLMLTYMQRMYDHSIALSKVATEYRRDTKRWEADPQGVVAAMQDYAEKNPIFNQADIDAITRLRSAAPSAEPPAPQSGPQPGAVEGGYRFKGGNPADKNNWEKIR